MDRAWAASRESIENIPDNFDKIVLYPDSIPANSPAATQPLLFFALLHEQQLDGKV